MKLATVFAVVLSLTTVAAADTAPAKPPAAGSGSGGVVAKADAAKFLAFFDKLTDAAVADKAACPKMATDINSIIDANKALLDMAAKAKADGKKLSDDDQKHMQADGNKMMPAIMGCKDNKDVMAAIQRLK